MEFEEQTRKLLAQSALLTAVASGVLGPPITFTVQKIAPQPEWKNVSLFSEHYQMCQSLHSWSVYFAFILICVIHC
ncbi:MAG: hypothetical protein P8Y68_14705, partial [Anaerolineales bacterium]